MIKIGILGSSGRVGSLLIDDLKNDTEAKVSCVHVFDKIEKVLPPDTVVTNDINVLFEQSDVIIDFSSPVATEELLTAVKSSSVATGLEKSIITSLSSNKIFISFVTTVSSGKIFSILSKT